MIVYVMSRPSLLLYIMLVNTFTSVKNIFRKYKNIIVWKVIFPYYFSNRNCDIHIVSAYHFQANV